MTDLSTPTLGELVADNPAAARVLDRYGLDYCCHGERTLQDACRTAGIDAGEVAATLADLAVEGDRTWTTLEPAALADHITATHHRYLHEELPLLDGLAAKVLGVHGDRHPELAEVRRLVAEIKADLEPHLAKEEQILFPAIAAGRDVAGPVRVMLMEHEQAGELLVELRRVTGGYAVPDDGCASYRSLYERLDALELDTHLHIHKENHTLFPAALRAAAGKA